MKLKIFFAVILLFVISFIFRFRGIYESPPFWVDEFSTVKDARYILEKGIRVFTDDTLIFEKHNITTHFIVAAFFKLFGQTEYIARLPFVIIGSLVPSALFLLGKKLFNSTVALSSSLLAATSYLLITWSRQSRGYVLQEFLIILSLYCYISYLESKKKFYAYALFILLLLGVLTHLMVYLLIISLFIHFIYLKRKKLSYKLISLLIVFTGIVLWTQGVFGYLSSSVLWSNNVWYYHSYLWRVYGVISFLSILGLGLALLRKKYIFIFLLYISIQLVYVSFVFGHYMTKYLLPIFPFLFLFASYAIYELVNHGLENFHKYKYSRDLLTLLPIFIILFIIMNGDKFVFKPKLYYSPNNDFREIAVVDYHKVYSKIIKDGYISNGKTAIIETWPDRARWYLGNNMTALHLFRWDHESGRVSGHVKKTDYKIDSYGVKYLERERLPFVGTKSDLLKVMKKYPRGYLYIDDETLPKDVIDYAKSNLKQEIYIDNHPQELAVNPFSIWPATLYSWGISE